MIKNLDNNLLEINLKFKDYLNSKKGILSCFYNKGVQLEGWFKGELLYFLSNLKESKKIYDFDREVKSPVSNQRIDFKLEFKINNSNEVLWLEIKH
ncbi:unnamed protein product, partial [marine sediment metagenome]